MEPVAHFGLGKATTIESVVITWPDGSTTTLNRPEPNQLYRVHHPASSKETEIASPTKSTTMESSTTGTNERGDSSTIMTPGDNEEGDLARTKTKKRKAQDGGRRG